MNGIEPDLWQLWLTAGAMWRAARAQPDRHDYWTASALAFSARGTVLLSWDSVAWARAADPDEHL